MGKKRGSGKGPKPNRGPFTAADFIAALTSQGYVRERGAKHEQYSHPTRPGKVSIDLKWDSVRCGDWVFNSVARQSRYGKDRLLRLLNGLAPESDR